VRHGAPCERCAAAAARDRANHPGVLVPCSLSARISRLTSSLRLSIGEGVACRRLRDTHVQHARP
jgi:hypothetical protein